MKKASITEAKNQLSRLIDQVKEGNTVLILDRNIPVARLTPVDEAQMASSDLIAGLVRNGLAREPETSLDARKFTARSMAKLKKGTSAVAAVIDERRASR